MMSRFTGNLLSASRPRPTVWSCLLVAAVLTAPSLAQRVVVVLGGDSAPYKAAADACVAELRGAGADVSVQGAAGIEGSGHQPEDVFVVVGARAAKAVIDAGADSSALVYCMLSEQESRALAGRPRTTGVTTTVAPADQFDVLGRALPSARRIGVLHRASSAASTIALDAARRDLPRGWTLVEVDLDASASVAGAITELTADAVDAVWTIPDAAVFDGATIKALLLAALRSRTPVFGFSGALVKAGTVVGVGIDPEEQGRQAGEIVRKLIENPDEVPPRRGPRFEIALNMIVAEKIGVEIPAALEREADDVYR